MTQGKHTLLTPQESVLLLLDHQPFQYANLHSHEPTTIVNNVVGLARTARAFGVPTVLTTVLEEFHGYLIMGLQDVFPAQEPINRTTINAWEDGRIIDAIQRLGRKKIVMAGLWTEIGPAMPAIQTLGDGYEVYFVTDASGGVSREAHDMAVQRMIQAGGIPMSWMAVQAEWQRDWARELRIPALADVLLQHGGGSGIAIAWARQLLASANTSGSRRRGSGD